MAESPSRSRLVVYIGYSTWCQKWDAKDLPLAFKSFKEHCNFMFGGQLKSKSEEEKCNYVMMWAGEKRRNIYSTWTLTNKERKQLAIHYEKKMKITASLNPTKSTPDIFS